MLLNWCKICLILYKWSFVSIVLSKKYKNCNNNWNLILWTVDLKNGIVYTILVLPQCSMSVYVNSFICKKKFKKSMNSSKLVFAICSSRHSSNSFFRWFLALHTDFFIQITGSKSCWKDINLPDILLIIDLVHISVQ